VSSLAQIPAERPEVAVVRHPIADSRNNVVGYELRFRRPIALDEYDCRPDIGTLMALCSIVRVNVGAVGVDALPGVIEAPRLQKALLVATDVADHETFNRCRELGFTYFEGAYFAQLRLFRRASVATAGLGSLLDPPMAEVLSSLPFTEEIQAALLRREGPKGELLSSVIAYERGEFPSLPSPGVSLASAYRAALGWAEDAGRAIDQPYSVRA
jgi:c-di-GMP-related signal transduction protein